MNRCPITYEESGAERYSRSGLRRLSQRLTLLNDFPYSAETQRREAVVRAGKMSIQGIQPKLSARLNAARGVFEICDKDGRYILKPQHAVYPELPQNEDLTMRLAKAVGIETPLHGMIWCQDGSLTYFIKRFDRLSHRAKLAVEDFAQLAGKDRESKYRFSMEKIVPLLDYCTFPAIQRAEFFKRCVFNYLVGNEDMHLKNFSLITRDGRTELSPAYDFLNTTIAYQAMGKPLRDIEEIALTLAGKKKGLTRSIWMDDFAAERLALNPKIISDLLSRFSAVLPGWKSQIEHSFLSDGQKTLYLDLLDTRCGVLGIG